MEENYYTGDGITISRNLINDRSVVERSWYYSKAPLPPETGDNFWCIATGLPWRPGYTTYEMQLFSVLSPSPSIILWIAKKQEQTFSFFLLKNNQVYSEGEEEEDNIHDSSQFRHRRPLRFGPSDSTIESEYEGTKVVAPVVLSFKWRLYKFFN